MSRPVFRLRQGLLSAQLALVLVLLVTGILSDLRQAILETVRHELGPVAVIGEVNVVAMLPKRAAEATRRVLKAGSLDRNPGDKYPPLKTKDRSKTRDRHGPH